VLLKILTVFSLLVGTAQAAEFRLVGEAELKFMFWSVYNSRLYSVDGDYREGQLPLRLEIEYRLPVKSEALVARTLQEWDQQGLQHEKRQQWLEALAQLWPDLDESDVLTLEVDESGTSTFFHNDQRLGRIEDQEFGPQFLAIWLSPRTSRPELRASLIGSR
jgi:hypothetical protein